jgi:integrase/recombinase XerD
LKKGLELIQQFETWVKNQGKSQNTVTTYRGVLQKFYQWLIEELGKDISEIEKEDVQAYMNFLDEEQNRSASTIDKVFAIIRVLSQFLDQPDIVQDIKKKSKERNIYQKIPEYLNENEKKQLLVSVEKDGNLRNIAIVYTLLFTGVRISELCKLNYSDIKIQEQKGIIIIRNTEGKEQRVIPLSKKVIYHLHQYINSLDKKDGKLFVSRDNKTGITTRAVQYMLKSYNMNPIKLRHTFCQDLINRGIDVSIVAQLAGHNDINMTKRYKKQSKIRGLKDRINQALA